MQRFRWIALQGSSRGFLPPLLLFYFITTSGLPAFAADVSAACGSPVARVVSIQGSIEVLRTRQNDWSKVSRLDTPLCAGDRLRAGLLSRAALFIQPETLVRVDQNTSITVNQNAEETLVEFTQAEVLPAAAASAYSCGAGYFITRFPRKFRVKTPHLNAAVEGTEFLVAMRCESTELSVFEGKVLAASTGANIFPTQSISSGQMLTIGGNEPPTVKLLVKPLDAVQWVIHYPPLSDATAEADLPPADQCRSLPKPLDQTCLTQRAEALLRVGRVDEAQREIDEAVAFDPAGGDANALRAIISIARNDKAAAIEAATAATSALPNSSRAWLALSYAQQASFKLEDSLSSARRAQSLEPNSSVTNARVAELLMSLGRIKEAEKAARAAVDANPSESRAHTVLGFVRLVQIKTKDARADFLAAIERDSSDPLPRLGLGLAIIRTGELAEGREQLEIAVALDPTNSLLRSYVGKAYYEENTKERDELASSQFGLAKQLDPNDPTPWFYESILRQVQNRPVEALEHLQNSIALNDNRAVYRSRFLLDEDRAAREASLARTYQSLGLSQAALAEAAKSMAGDPANYSAHRFLADTYALRPRQEITRASELLQAQLYEPLGSIPLQPQLAKDDLLPLRGAGISTGGLYEYNRLFERDGLHFQFYGVTGEDDTRGDQEIISGLIGATSFGVSHSGFDSNGFRANNDLHKTLDDAFFQLRLSDSISAQIEASRFDQNTGDLRVAFDPTFDELSRHRTQEEIYRVGVRAQVSPSSTFLISAYRARRFDELTAPGFDPILTQQGDGRKVEGEYVLSTNSSRWVVGTSYFSADKTDGGLVVDPPVSFRPLHFNAHAYAYVPLPSLKMSAQIGLGFDRLRSQETGDLRSTNPKFGLIWTPTEATTVRMAKMTTLRRQFMTDQSLEPTQVAGFAQYYDDREGAIARRTVIAIDHRIDNHLFMGALWGKREISSPVIIDVATGQRDFDPWVEKEANAYLGWAPAPSALFTAEVQWERYERPFRTDFLGFIVVDTWYYPLSVRLFRPEGISLVVTSTYVHQDGQFFDSSQTIFDGQESFWVTDAAIDYRLPKRTGILSMGIRNAFGENFRFQ